MRVYKTEDYIEKGKSIHIFSSKRNRPEPIHTHDFIEIIYILSGTATHVINNQDYSVRHGDLLFLNYGSTHAFSTDGEFSYINICFSPETLGQTVVTPENAFSLLSLTAFNDMRGEADGGVFSFFGAERKELEELLSAMLREFRQKQTAWHGVLESYLNILITKMLRKTELGVSAEATSDMWQELSEYIDANLDAPLTLSALAKKCFYNPSYFSRVFKEKFGASPLDYINRKRLEQAMELLCREELSIDEISLRAGFTDRRNFYHAFAKYVGGTPSEYRRMHAKVKKSDKNDPSCKK